MTIASFRRKSVPRLGGDAPKREREKFRGSARDRGYTREWDALGADYKKSIAGQCEECLRRGYLHQCDVIDHMMPVTDEPDHRLDKHNLDGLCHVHHNGFKRRIEDYARKTGAIKLLPQKAIKLSKNNEWHYPRKPPISAIDAQKRSESRWPKEGAGGTEPSGV